MDFATAHRHLSVSCFNETWALLERPDRTPEEDRRMREMAHASLYHWLERADGTPTHVSIGVWLVSRVHAVLGQGPIAMAYARECIEVSAAHALSAFYVGYGHEAAARSAELLGDRRAFEKHLSTAWQYLGEVTDPSEAACLRPDLEALSTV